MTDNKQTSEDGHPDGPQETRVSDRITRREWLAKAGMAALVAGLPTDLGAEKPDTESSSGALPPGLYLPSSEHLGHALASDEVFRTIPPGCETDYVQPVSGGFEPAFFSQSEFQAVSCIVALLLGLASEEGSRQGLADQNGSPENDRENTVETVAQWIDLRMASAPGVRQAARALAPGHRVLAVHYYGQGAVERLESEEPDKACREGLAWLEHQSRQKYGAEFVRLTEPQQIGILESISGASKTVPGDRAGIQFFELIKAETIRGYYTSPRGLHELNCKGNSFYPQSPGCPKRGELERARLLQFNPTLFT